MKIFVCRLTIYHGILRMSLLKCGKLVRQAVLDKVKKSFYYSIIVDGTPDVSHIQSKLHLSYDIPFKLKPMLGKLWSDC